MGNARNAISRAVRAVIEPVERRILFATALDPTWGDAGVVTEPYGSAADARVWSVGVQGDGKLVVLADDGSGGTAPHRTLVRYNTDGSLDGSFGDGGVLALTGDAGSSAAEIAVMPDDRILLSLVSFGADPILEMRTADGAPDASFGEDGRVELHHEVDLQYRIAVTFTVAPDGDIYVQQSGTTYAEDGTSTSPTEVWRLNADGSPDTGFGGDGQIRFDEDSGNFALSVQPDGDLLLAWTNRLHRVTPDGTFHADINEVPIGPREIIGFQSDGKILVLASTYYETRARVARLNEDGSLDETYGEDGYAISGGTLPGIVYDPDITMVVDSQDRAVVFLTEGRSDLNRFSTQMVRFDAAGRQEALGIVDALPLEAGYAPNAVAAHGDDGKILLLSTSPYRIQRVADDVDLPDVHLTAGTLNVMGTASADTITVGKSGSNVVLTRNGATTTYPAADVREVAIDALDGNDSVTVNDDLTATVVTRGGADTIKTSGGTDFIRSGDGDDVVTTAIGQDTVDSGSGDDSVTCGDVFAEFDPDEPRIDGSHRIDGGDGDDTITTGAGEDFVDAGGGNNRVVCGAFEDDVYTRGDGNGVGGQDGDNYVEEPSGGFVYSGAGDDTILAVGQDWPDSCWVFDTGGDDSITLGEGFDYVELSGGGRDTVATAGGRDGVQYLGGDAAAGIGLTVDTAEGDDAVHADVALEVRIGPDEWFWGDESDVVYVGLALGPIYLGVGNDRVRVRAGNATIYGGEGNDTIQTGDGRDSIYCGAGNDVVHAGSASDLICGGGGADKLFGQGGPDRIYAGAGNDRLDGQGGNDRLRGDAGADLITGGGGSDARDDDDEDTVAGVESLLAVLT